MAITYEDKESLRENGLPLKNQVTASDMNEIKTEVNAISNSANTRGEGRWKLVTFSSPSVDPGAGSFNFDQSSIPAATKFRINKNDLASAFKFDAINNFGDNDTFLLVDSSDETNQIYVRLSNKTDKTGYIEFDVANIESYGTITINTDFFLITLKGNSGVVWKNDQIEGDTYDKNDWARRNSWMGVANSQTKDLLDPQNTGLPSNAVDLDAQFTSNSDTSVIKMVHKFTIEKDGYLKSVSVKIPEWNLDSISRISLINITNGTTEVINNPILSSDNWIKLVVGNNPIKSGALLEMWFEFYNSSELNRIIGGWFSNNGTGYPESQQFNIDNLSNPTVIEVSHTDLDSVSRTAELDGVISGSIININETGDIARNVDVKVNSVDLTSGVSTKYNVTLISNGSKNIRDGKNCTINIDVPITQPSIYSGIVNYYPTNKPTWASVTSELYFGGVLQGVPNGNAYGINLEFQEAEFSNDWDIWPISGGGTGQVQTGVFQESTTLHIIDSGQSFPTNSVGTLLANDSVSVIDSSKGGVKIGHGNYDVAGSFFDLSLIDKPCQIIFKAVYQPNNNAVAGIEYRTYSDKTNIPGSLINSQTSAYKTSRTGMDNEVTTSFNYDPINGSKAEALQIFGVSQSNENITLKFFNIWINKLWT